MKRKHSFTRLDALKTRAEVRGLAAVAHLSLGVAAEPSTPATSSQGNPTDSTGQ